MRHWPASLRSRASRLLRGRRREHAGPEVRPLPLLHGRGDGAAFRDRPLPRRALRGRHLRLALRCLQASEAEPRSAHRATEKMLLSVALSGCASKALRAVEAPTRARPDDQRADTVTGRAASEAASLLVRAVPFRTRPESRGKESGGGRVPARVQPLRARCNRCCDPRVRGGIRRWGRTAH